MHKPTSESNTPQPFVKHIPCASSSVSGPRLHHGEDVAFHLVGANLRLGMGWRGLCNEAMKIQGSISIENSYHKPSTISS